MDKEKLTKINTVLIIAVLMTLIFYPYKAINNAQNRMDKIEKQNTEQAKTIDKLIKQNEELQTSLTKSTLLKDEYINKYCSAVKMNDIFCKRLFVERIKTEIVEREEVKKLLEDKDD